MGTTPQSIYLGILAKVVEDTCQEIIIKDDTREYDVIRSLNESLGQRLDEMDRLNFFKSPIIGNTIKVEVFGEERHWTPDIFVETSDGIGFFIELYIGDDRRRNFTIRELSLHLYSRLHFVEKQNILGGVLVYINRNTRAIQVEEIINGNSLEEISIFEQDLDNGKGKVAILIASQYALNPEELLDRATYQYVGDKRYNQFVDIRKDNPRVRVITTGINELTYGEFNKQQL